MIGQNVKIQTYDWIKERPTTHIDQMTRIGSVSIRRILTIQAIQHTSNFIISSPPNISCDLDIRVTICSLRRIVGTRSIWI